MSGLLFAGMRVMWPLKRVAGGVARVGPAEFGPDELPAGDRLAARPVGERVDDDQATAALGLLRPFGTAAPGGVVAQVAYLYTGPAGGHDDPEGHRGARTAARRVADGVGDQFANDQFE